MQFVHVCVGDNFHFMENRSRSHIDLYTKLKSFSTDCDAAEECEILATNKYFWKILNWFSEWKVKQIQNQSRKNALATCERKNVAI